MNIPILIQNILREINADTILEHTEAIWKNNRTSNFADYQKTSEYVMRMLKEYGLSVENIDIPADGKTQFGDCIIPMGWNCRAGRIELVKPVDRLLGNREETPNCIGMWSPATEECDIEAEVVYLSSGEPGDLRSLDVKDKLILTPGCFEDIRNEAIAGEALGIISFWYPSLKDMDYVQWIRSNSGNPGGWGPKKGEKTIISLNITPKDGEDLAEIAEKETPRVRIRIESSIEETSLATIHAVIQGESNDQEVLIIAPLYDQGANFNAVGAAILLEIARILNLLIEKKIFPRPSRNIRFLMTAKKYGSIAFAHHYLELLKKTVYALYLESGAGNPDNAWCRWNLYSTPVCQRHFADGLTWFLLTEYLKSWRPQRFLEAKPFSLVGDVYYNDPAIGVPTHWLYGGTEEEYRYTSADTPECIDRRSCIDLGSASAVILYTLSSVTVSHIPQIAYWNYNVSLERLQNDLRLFIERGEEVRNLTDVNDLLGEAIRHFPLRYELETQGMLSLERLVPEAKSSMEWSTVKEFLAMLKDQSESAVTVIRNHLEAKVNQMGIEVTRIEITQQPLQDERIPKRIGDTTGTITLDTIPYENWTSPVKQSPRNNVPYILSWWLTDGKRTIGEIERIVKMEVPQYRECIPAWFTFLEKHGYVEFAAKEEN